MSLPYVVPNVGVQRNFDHLVRRLPTFVTALPVSAQNGQEIYYLASAANGVVWHLRYREASSSAYKWEFIGGAALYAKDAAEIETESATYVTGKGPSVTIPLAGDYEVGLTSQLVPSANETEPIVVVKFGAAAAEDNDGVVFNTVAGGLANTVGSRTMTRTGLTAASVLEMVYRRVNAGKGKFLRREIWARPVRVG